MSVGLTSANAGEVFYPGIQSYEAFQFTDISGVQPATGWIRMFPQFGLPAQDGDLVISYNANSVTIRNCHIVSASYEVGSGGQVVTVQIVDERWTWHSSVITGRYNYRQPNNWVDPNHEKTPQELATLCFQAMGVALFDVSQLPNVSRPDVNWDHSNPAQELEKICSDLGCRVVPQRSTGAWIVQITGVGSSLPESPLYDASGAGIDPKEVPDYLMIVSAPVRYQVFLPLAPIGRDFDLSWKRLKDLSYAPSQNDTQYQGMTSCGFYRDPWEFGFMTSLKLYIPRGVPNYGTQVFGTRRWPLADGTKKSAQELARESVFKSWRVDFANQDGAQTIANLGTAANPVNVWGMKIPGITDGYVAVDQIILTKDLVQTYTDYLGAQHARPAFVSGEFWGELTEAANGGNYPPGTRIDKQANRSDTRMDETASFSLSLDPIDTYRSIVTTSKPMLKFQAYATERFVPAKLQLCCAINVRDPVTWQPYRNEYLYQIGSGTNQNFCRVVVKDDIQPWVIGNYPTGSNTFTSYTSNFAEVALQSQYYAQSIASEYMLTTSQTRTYIGILPIDMDGAIQQITYSIDGHGTSTTASQGTEHSIITPQFEERRQQVARRGVAEKLDYARYETARRTALIGAYNT